jgi:hypothetical protein
MAEDAREKDPEAEVKRQRKEVQERRERDAEEAQARGESLVHKKEQSTTAWDHEQYEKHKKKKNQAFGWNSKSARTACMSMFEFSRFSLQCSTMKLSTKSTSAV